VGDLNYDVGSGIKIANNESGIYFGILDGIFEHEGMIASGIYMD